MGDATDLTRLQRNGPQCSSDDIAYIHQRYELPSPPGLTRNTVYEDILDRTETSHAYEAFRRFVKIAAHSCVRLSSYNSTVDDVRLFYLDVAEAMAGLRESLLAMPLSDKTWLEMP